LDESVSHIQGHVRDILKRLRPDGLAQTGLAVAIGNLATFWQRHHGGIAIHLDIEAEGFGAETDPVIYRLVQEGLTNAVRHGAAKQVWITIAADPGTIHVIVEDDGIGFTDAGGTGMGLKGMRERLAALSGSMSLGPRPGGGTRLSALIPNGRVAEPA
ncbi:MAG TPA: ATP-binding protein, partial [Rhizomicrobium sp.]|nr:ATP-binding protein [Rhizomicrobium sp.]